MMGSKEWGRGCKGVMAERVIEGTWEEIAEQGGQLSGKRVRLTVLDEISPEGLCTRKLILTPDFVQSQRLHKSLLWNIKCAL